MQISQLEIGKILSLDKWQELQDSLASITKLALITTNYKGEPFTLHSQPRQFCQAVRGNPDLERYCHKCDSRAGLEAVKTNAPFIYKCHFGIIDMAIPIHINNMYLGALLAGQVHLSPESRAQDLDLEQIFSTHKTAILTKDPELLALYNAIPVLSYEEIQTAAAALFSLASYIVDEALDKNLLMATVASEQQIAITQELVPDTTCHNLTLAPALTYIQNHPEKSISQSDMAKLCNISTGHFSRLFMKETGLHFKSYVTKQRIERSKIYLQSTDLSITAISDMLDFSEPSYYIKTFKKLEHMTPNDYRKYRARS